VNAKIPNSEFQNCKTCPYTVPRPAEKQLRTEIARLVDIGFLEEDYTSEWASPTFAISKKTGTIRVVFISESSIPYLYVSHFLYQRLGI
jgi:hypothetical protein